MTTLTNYYENSKLATGAYVTMDGQPLDPAILVARSNNQGRLPTTLGIQTFSTAGSQWTIPAGGYYGNDDNGFAATLFERGSEKVLAIRGTEPGGIQFLKDLIQADLAGIGVLGMALPQAISMVNYILRLVTPQDKFVAQITAHTSLTQPTAPFVKLDGILPLTSVYIHFTSTAIEGLGRIAAGEKIRVTGHSLGGHLAALAARLFPGIVEEGYLFNSPGFDPTAAKFVPLTSAILTKTLVSQLGFAASLISFSPQRKTEQFINQLFAPYVQAAVGQGPAAGFAGLALRNVESEDVAPGNDVSLVSSVLTGQQIFGSEVLVATEPNSHLIEPLLDALSLHSVMFAMNNALGPTNTNGLLEASSVRASDSEESLLKALYRLVTGSPIALPLSDGTGGFGLGKGATPDREAYYQRLLEFEAAVKANPSFVLQSLIGANAADLLSGAQDPAGFAYRYALTQLNPFVISGANYTAHNTGGRISLYDANTGAGLTQAYLADRAEMLLQLVQRNQNDVLIVSPGASPQTDYIDRRVVLETAGGITREVLREDKVLVGGGLVRTDARKVAFGSELGDTFRGSGLADRMYGGDGNDRLVGLGGLDHLEGGRGDDVLEGGAGDDVLDGGKDFDTYVWNTGDGRDTIRDDDRQGNLVINGRTVNIAYALGGNSWRSADGTLTLTQNSPLTIQTQDGAEIVIEDFQDGDFGIQLEDAPTAPETTRTIVGDLAPVDFDPGTPGVQTQVDDLGNVITDPAQAEPGRADTLFDSTGNDLIQAFAGNDVIEASRGGDDKLDGGAGRDIVSGRAGHDIVIGGTEGDLLRGDAGRDRVYGTSEMTVEAALAGQDAPGTGLRGDFIDGGADDDTLISGADNDALNGGAGGDLIIGGGGDDDVDGDLETSIVSLDWSVTREVIDLGGITLYNRTYNGVGFLSTSPGGDDVVYGGGGADWLFTREGDDWIDAGAGQDVVFGEAGSDDIFGGDGNDKLFGDSASVPFAQHGDDYIDGEQGDDEMNGDGGDDVLFGGDGNDTMFGDSTAIGGADYLDGEAGDDVILGAGNSDTIYGGTGADFLQGDSGTGSGDGGDFISGDAGDDILIGEGGDDQLDGGADADVLIGNAGMDVLLGGAGNDQIAGDEGGFDPSGDSDFIDGGDGSDLVDGQGGDDTILGGAGNDNPLFGGGLLGGAGNDFISGDAGDDQLQGGEGDDVLDGGSENDVLFGESGNDTLSGGAGSDQLIGGFGDDVLAGGDGDDVYFYSFGDGRDHISDTGGTDFLVFTDLFLGNLRLDVGSLKIVLPDGGELHLDDFDPDNPLAGSIEWFQFADFSVLSRQEMIQALGFRLQGTPGDDALSGTAAADSIQAFAGNDVVSGRAGNDSIDLGAGDDFADAGDGSDNVLAGDGNDVVLGGAGGDTLNGGAGSDALFGGAGIDQLLGGIGDDQLAGGTENDTLEGGEGNDLYLFGAADGQDVAIDASGANRIQLIDGLTESQVSMRRVGNDLLIDVTGTSHRFTARDWFANAAAWNQLGLGDGTILDRAGVEARLVQNQAPILAPDTVSTFEDNFVAVSGNALTNDFDPEGRALSVTNPGTQLGSYGALTLQANGVFSYTVDNGWEGVQSLAQGQTVSDSFVYTATDNDPAGAASASSTITVNVAGRNDAPIASLDFDFVAEDFFTQTSGNVLFNDSDIDNGAVLHVVSPGTFEGAYGTLSLGMDGSYTYTLRNSSTAVQSLGQFAEAAESFAYTASDGSLQSGAELRLGIFGNNDAPVLAVPLADQTAVAGRSFTYAVPQGSFTDIDVGDVLSYSASLVDGFELPAWLSFEASTQTFTGTAPSDATGFIDVEVRATDGRTGGGGGGAAAALEFGDGEEGEESSASDVFRITFASHGGGGGGGGQGNEGVGNGEDPPPPGHDENFNDGPGTSPGNPGAKGGNGLGHSMPTLHVSPIVAQTRQVQSAAAWRQVAADHPGNGEGNNGSAQQPQSGSELASPDAPLPQAEQPSTLSGDADEATSDVPPAEGYDPVAARLSQEPYYDFEALLAWFAQGGPAESLDPEEIRRRWARVAAANYAAPQDDPARGAALAWQRLAAALAAGSAAGLPASAQFTGLTGGLPALDTFRGLNEGLQRL